VLALGLVATQIIGCGGSSGLPPSSSVLVAIAPASATVPANGTVILEGSAAGFTENPIVMWGIMESSDTVPVSGCGLLASQDPAIGAANCTHGYVVTTDVTTFPSAATYHAPATPGVYHVVFTATQSSTFDHLQKSATATITVTAIGP